MAEEIVLGDHNVSRVPLQDELTRLYSQGFLTDITLSTEDGKNFEAHRILLAARSTYFHSVVPRLKSDPVIFLKGVKGAHLDKILKFIYSGKVALSRHQLKPILEVAKSLQVSGLADLNPMDILQQQQPSALGQTRIRMHQLETSKRPGNSPSAGFKMASIGPNRVKMGKARVVNGSPARETDESDEGKKGESEDEDEGRDVPPKRKRGRPPKMPKEGKSNDPYEFDADEPPEGGIESKKAEGPEGEPTEAREEEEESLSATAAATAAASKRERSNKYATQSINGKHVLPVTCKEQQAELHLSRFANGIRGKSIKYKDEWMTPQEFELACGSTGKKYLENIRTDYGPLKTLTTSGLLKPHSRKCRCTICRGEEKTTPEKMKRKHQEIEGLEWDGGDGGEQSSGAIPLGEAGGEQGNLFIAKEEKHDSDFDFHSGSGAGDELRDSPSKSMDGSGSKPFKKKKKKHKNDEWKEQLNEKVAQANAAAMVASNNELAIPQGMAMVMGNGALGGEQEQQDHGPMQGAAAVTFSYSSLYDTIPPKISSPAAILTDRIEPPQLQQPTFYVMSPHPAQAPPTPQHNPFSVPMPPAPPTPTPLMSPAPLPQVSQIQTPPTVLQALPPPSTPTPSVVPISDSPSPPLSPSPPHTPSSAATKATTSLTTTTTSGGSSIGGTTSTSSIGGGVEPTKMNSSGVAKLGSVMNVRCKSTTALLYACKYETGSKGKCINLGNEWLTPNEFEDRAGSKAKKYLSSIKCMGRPLRVYVNSGELKGSGPPPPPKPKKVTNLANVAIKHTPIQPAPTGLTPAPPIATTPLTLAVAPPTPTHISSAPPVPGNLNMMMGNPNPPILINQTSIAGTNLMGSQPVFNAPMTFTVAQPIEVRQNSLSQTM